MDELNKIISSKPISAAEVAGKIRTLLNEGFRPLSDPDCASLIDFAFLDENESSARLHEQLTLIRKMYDLDFGFRYASICVYPNYVALAKSYMKNTNTLVSAVAGNFPTGQALRKNKLMETRYAIDEGADEIDYIYSIGNMLDKNYQEVFDELKAVREVCNNTRLKIILETGLLDTLKDVRIASGIALNSGADFIKTSTGKSGTGATLESAYVMIRAVKRYHEESGKKAGVKFSGGISAKEDASKYFHLTEKLLGREWANPAHFRIGASKLALKLLDNGIRRSNMS